MQKSKGLTGLASFGGEAAVGSAFGSSIVFGFEVVVYGMLLCCPPGGSPETFDADGWARGACYLSSSFSAACLWYTVSCSCLPMSGPFRGKTMLDLEKSQ